MTDIKMASAFITKEVSWVKRVNDVLTLVEQNGIVNLHTYMYFDVMPHHSQKHEVSKLYIDTYSTKKCMMGKHVVRYFRVDLPRIDREGCGIQVCCVSSAQITIKEIKRTQLMLVRNLALPNKSIIDEITVKLIILSHLFLFPHWLWLLQKHLSFISIMDRFFILNWISH